MQKFSYLCLLLVTSMGALFSQIEYSYVPFLVLCSEGIIALLYSDYLKSIQLTVEGTDDNLIELKFKQKWRVPFHVRYEATYKHFISNESQIIRGSFFSNERVHIEKIQFTSAFCGQLVLKNLRLVYSDSLGFASVKIDYQRPCSVFQMPRILFTELSASNISSSIAMGTEVGPKERFATYMPGDSVASIHWAMSARTQSLIVRKEAFATQQTLQGIALYFNDITTVEDYDECMATYYNLLLQQEYTTVFVWQNEWVTYDLTSVDEVNHLFHKLFLVPLQKLYAESPPPKNTVSMHAEGGYGL